MYIFKKGFKTEYFHDSKAVLFNRGQTFGDADVTTGEVAAGIHWAEVRHAADTLRCTGWPHHREFPGPLLRSAPGETLLGALCFSEAQVLGTR